MHGWGDQAYERTSSPHAMVNVDASWQPNWPQTFEPEMNSSTEQLERAPRDAPAAPSQPIGQAFSSKIYDMWERYVFPSDIRANSDALDIRQIIDRGSTPGRGEISLNSGRVSWEVELYMYLVVALLTGLCVLATWGCVSAIKWVVRKGLSVWARFVNNSPLGNINEITV